MRRRRENPEPPAPTHKAFTDQRMDYSASRRNSYRRDRKGTIASGTNADYHTRAPNDLFAAMELARDMERNDQVTSRVLQVAVDETIQAGITPNPQTGDEDTNKRLTELWHDWSMDPMAVDVSNELAWNGVERLTFRALLRDGDIFAVPTIREADDPLAPDGLEIFEAHRCRTPANAERRRSTQVIHGVHIDNFRRRLEYWFTRSDIDPMGKVQKVADMRKLPAFFEDTSRAVYHIRDETRVSQTRGFTALNPIIDHAGQFEDLNFANLVRAQIAACIGWIRKKSSDGYVGTTKLAGINSTTEYIGDATRVIDNLAPGMLINAQAGEEWDSFSPNVPNPEYFEHAKLLLTMIGAQLGVPLVLLLLDASETNFSGWRGAVDSARRGFMRNQRTMIEHLHEPTYRWKVNQWIDEDPALLGRLVRLGIPGAEKAIYRHTWHRPRWPYIEPLKDTQADALQIEKRLNSHRRILAQRGLEHDEVLRETIDDNRAWADAAMQAAQELRDKHPGEEVDWRELLNLNPQRSISGAIDLESTEPTNEPRANANE